MLTKIPKISTDAARVQLDFESTGIYLFDWEDYLGVGESVAGADFYIKSLKPAIAPLEIISQGNEPSTSRIRVHTTDETQYGQTFLITGTILTNYQNSHAQTLVVDVKRQFVGTDISATGDADSLSSVASQIFFNGENLLVKGIAGQAIQAYKVIAFGSNGRFFYADLTSPGIETLVIGLSQSSSLIGNSATGIRFGKVQNLSWSWVSQQPVYLGNNGDLTQVNPSTGRIISLGVAVSSNQVLVDIRVISSVTSTPVNPTPNSLTLAQGGYLQLAQGGNLQLASSTAQSLARFIALAQGGILQLAQGGSLKLIGV